MYLLIKEVDQELNHEIFIKKLGLEIHLFIETEIEIVNGFLKHHLQQSIQGIYIVKLEDDDTTEEKFSFSDVMHHIAHDICLTKSSIPMEADEPLFLIENSLQ